MEELISIIMPVYNREQTVKQSVESVLAQSYSHFEMIIVDDASTDQTAEVIKEIDDQRIRYIKHTENRGACAARNTGILAAEGNWIAFQDSDDIWNKKKLEKQVNAISKSTSSKQPIIFTSFIRHKEGKKEHIPENNFLPQEGSIHKELLVRNFISTQTVLLPKSYLLNEMFAEDMPRFQDWELWIRLSKRYPFYWIDESLVDVYYTNDSISSEIKKVVEAYEKIREKHFRYYQEAGSEYVAALLFSYGHNLCLAGELKKGRAVLLQSFIQNKKSMKPIITLASSLFGKQFYSSIYSHYTR